MDQMTDLALFGGDNLLTALETSTPAVREQIRDYLNRKSLEETIARIEAEKDQMRRDLSEVKSMVDEQNERIRDVQETGAKKLFASDKYYTRTALGDLFSPVIKNQHMTRLLRVVGIMAGNDVVREQYTRGLEPVAKRKPWSDYPTWVFHIGKVKARVDTWLEANGYLDAFHATITKEERDQFIDMLFEEHCS